jgi:hypothetical protein
VSLLFENLDLGQVMTSHTIFVTDLSLSAPLYWIIVEYRCVILALDNTFRYGPGSKGFRIAVGSHLVVVRSSWIHHTLVPVPNFQVPHLLGVRCWDSQRLKDGLLSNRNNPHSLQFRTCVDGPLGVHASIQRGFKLIYPCPQCFWVCHAPDVR